MSEQREVGDWILEQEIGSGSFARVWKATHKHSHQIAAVKEINVDRLSKKLQDSLTSEVAVLRHTKHHNIVCLLDLIRDNNRLYIVLEFCAGGDLGHYIKRYRQVSEAAARYFLRQLAEGLKELRRHNVIHRDLKPQNLLLSDSSSMPLLKIADFGFARSLAPQGLAETLCGSPLYMAPEILQFHKYDAKADLWSVGTIFFELLVGKPPFNGANHMQLLHSIERSEAKLPDHVAARLSEPCKSLLMRLLQRNPVRRISFEEFFTHPFLHEDAGATIGVPPSQPVSAGSSAAPAVLPAAMRQAMVAVTASAADKAVTAARPSLHKQAVHHPIAPAQYGQRPPVQQQQQQQQQQDRIRQHQAPPMHPVPAALDHSPGQQQLQGDGRVSSQQQGSSTKQQQLGLVAQPAKQHPLCTESEAAEVMSDSMEGDFVVVYNTSDTSSRKHSNSNSSSSKASSGLVDPKAAAVLQYPAASLAPQTMPWQTPGGSQRYQYPYTQQDQQPCAQADAGHWLPGPHCTDQQRQQQHVQMMPGHSIRGQYGPSDSHASPVGGGVWPLVPADSHMAPDVTCQSSVYMQPTAAQRVQLLVQVVRGCSNLLAKQASGANDTVLPAVQQTERLALMLLALQLVQVMCTPQLGGQHKQHETQPSALSSKLDDGVGVMDLLAAASQNDLEQLMSAAVELLALARAVPGLTGGAGGDGDEQHEHAGDPGAFGRMTASLLQQPLPDPFVVLYQEALDSCRGAAVEEVMGNWQASIAGYSLAADLLLYLSCEWQQFGAADPGLQAGERHELHALYRAVNGRLAAVVAETSPAIVY